MPHNSRPNLTNLRAAERYSRLRAAGVPSTLSDREAWFLSGGIVGTSTETGATVSLAHVAKRVPDCEHFLPDYREQYPAA